MGLIRAFGRWFGSASAVLWIFLLTTLAVAIEAAFPHLDQHGFWFLYWITYGSWITQPVLAYATRLDTQRSDQVLQHIEASGEQQKKAIAKIAALEGQVAALVRALAAREEQELGLLREIISPERGNQRDPDDGGLHLPEEPAEGL